MEMIHEHQMKYFSQMDAIAWWLSVTTKLVSMHCINITDTHKHSFQVLPHQMPHMLCEFMNTIYDYHFLPVQHTTDQDYPSPLLLYQTHS